MSETEVNFQFHTLNDIKPSDYNFISEASCQPQLYYGISPAISLTSNFHREQAEESSIENRFIYTRAHNPSFSLLEKQLAKLHEGTHATVFSSGMAAISAVICSLSQQGATILCGNEMYYEVDRCLETLTKLAGLKIIKTDLWNTEKTLSVAEKIEDLCILYLESANNPSSRMADLPVLSKELKRRYPNVAIVVDNTWLTPIVYKPLNHGADLVVESVTKYISGRGDVLLGAVISKSKEYQHKSHIWRSLHGAIPSPFNCWLVSKALETLSLRMEKVCHSAKIIASALERVPCVTRVLYLGLPSHPTYKRAKKLLGEGRCGVIYFHLPLDKESAKSLISQVPPILNATSYGSAHALLNIPKPGSSTQYDDSCETGIKGHWFRLAIGLQPPEEIIRALLIGFARYLSVPLGTVQIVYPKLKVVSIQLDKNNTAPFPAQGDLLIVAKEGVAGQTGFYEVSGEARIIEKHNEEADTYLTLPIPAGLMLKKKTNIKIRVFQKFCS